MQTFFWRSASVFRGNVCLKPQLEFVHPEAENSNLHGVAPMSIACWKWFDHMGSRIHTPEAISPESDGPYSFYLLWAIYIFAFSRCPAWTSRILLCGFRMAKFTICISAAASHKKSTIVPRSIHFTLIFVLSMNAPHFSLYLQYQGLELFYLLNLIIVIIGPIQDAVRSYGPLRTV